MADKELLIQAHSYKIADATAVLKNDGSRHCPYH
jgi:hypothetical protein